MVSNHWDEYEPSQDIVRNPIKYSQTKISNENNGDQEPTKIVIHHTATPANNDYDKTLTAINRSHAKRVHGLQPSNQLQDKYPDISYHYVIFPDGHIVQTRKETRIGWGTRENNVGAIHVTMVGDFTKEKPTQKQYDTINKLIGEIQQRWKIGEIKGHGQRSGEHTSCPGQNFDYLKIEQIKKWTQPIKGQSNKNESYLGTFGVTKYYSCDPNQTRYLKWEVKVLKKKLGRDPELNELYVECMRRQFNGDQDNTQPKHGARYTNKDAGIAVACPPEVPARSKLRIEGYKQILTCRDVGSAIVKKRLDLYVGAGDRAVDNYNHFPAGQHNIYLVK